MQAKVASTVCATQTCRSFDCCKAPPTPSPPPVRQSLLNATALLDASTVQLRGSLKLTGELAELCPDGDLCAARTKLAEAAGRFVALQLLAASPELWPSTAAAEDSVAVLGLRAGSIVVDYMLAVRRAPASAQPATLRWVWTYRDYF
jgi:hypothetical protein